MYAGDVVLQVRRVPHLGDIVKLFISDVGMDTKNSDTIHPGSPATHDRGRFMIGSGDFNFRQVEGPRRPTVAELLATANFEPASEYALLERSDANLLDLDLEERLDLGNGDRQFIAFRADHLSFFTLNDNRNPWGRDWIDGAALVALAGKSLEAFEVVQVLNDGSERIIAADRSVDLTPAGIERFFVRPQSVTIIVDRAAKKVARGEHRVSDLKRECHVPVEKELEQVVAGSLHPLVDDQVVMICGGEEFISHERRGSSS